MVLSVCYGLMLGTRLTPYNLPREPLQCRHMGVKPCQTNWGLLRRRAKAPHYNLFETKIHRWPVDTPHKGKYCRSISMCWRHHSPGELVYMWQIITRIMIMKTHCLQRCRCHDIDTSHGIDTSYHQTFVREIGPWITLKRIRNVNIFVLLTWSSCWASELPVIWYAVVLMWFHCNEEASSTMMCQFYSSHLWKCFCVKRRYR